MIIFQSNFSGLPLVMLLSPEREDLKPSFNM